LSEALGRLYEAILRLECSQAELNYRFTVLTARLRQFTIQPTDEDILLDELKHVLWELGVPNAEIYLTEEDSAFDASVYNAVKWTSAAALPHFSEERRRLTPFSARSLMREQGESSGSWMVVPLIFHDMKYGVAVVSRETSNEFLLPGLIQQFSTAIYTNRVHRAVKELSGLVPICGYCKRIRDDNDYWHSVEQYITDHTNAHFTHGVCPTCLEIKLREIDRA
jgi:hypothetical protein